VETKGLNLKAITLSELKEQEWINNSAKYPIIKSKSDLVTVPFTTGNTIPIVFTTDLSGYFTYWTASDEPTEYIGEYFHIHNSPIDHIVISNDDSKIFTMSSQDSMICQWDSIFI